MKSTPSYFVFFALSNETLLTKIDHKMAEKEAKCDLPDFLENWNLTIFWKSHISLKNGLFDLKIWLQRFLNMGYRMDIVKFKFEIFHVTWILDGLVDPLKRGDSGSPRGLPRELMSIIRGSPGNHHYNHLKIWGLPGDF